MGLRNFNIPTFDPFNPEGLNRLKLLMDATVSDIDTSNGKYYGSGVSTLSYTDAHGSDTNTVPVPDYTPENHPRMMLTLATMIELFISEHTDELSNETTDLYKLMKLFSVQATQAGYDAIFSFFAGLKTSSFTLEEFFIYFEENELEISMLSVYKFLVLQQESKREGLRRRIYNGFYSRYGNLDMFIERIFKETERTIFVRETASNSEMLKDARFYLLTPKISYFDTTLYRNHQAAETDYWNIVETYSDATTYTIDLLSNVKNTLINKSFDSRVYGTSLLMKNNVAKGMFSNESLMNETIVNILKTAYRYITLDDIHYFIEKMIGEVIDYNLQFDIAFDYSTNSTDLVDLENFVDYKLGILKELDIATITVMDLMEMNFYLEVMVPFLEYLTYTAGYLSAVIALRDTTLAEFESIRAELLAVRALLVSNGKFE